MRIRGRSLFVCCCWVYRGRARSPAPVPPDQGVLKTFPVRSTAPARPRTRVASRRSHGHETHGAWRGLRAEPHMAPWLRAREKNAVKRSLRTEQNCHESVALACDFLRQGFLSQSSLFDRRVKLWVQEFTCWFASHLLAAFWRDYWRFLHKYICCQGC